jgi:hypothetical protein
VPILVVEEAGAAVVTPLHNMHGHPVEMNAPTAGHASSPAEFEPGPCHSLSGHRLPRPRSLPRGVSPCTKPTSNRGTEKGDPMPIWESFLTCLGPTPAAPVVHLPVSFHKTTAFPTLGPGGPLAIAAQQLSCGPCFHAAVSCLPSGASICSPPMLLVPQCLSTPGRQGFYVSASPGLLPCRAGDMLIRPLSNN